MGAISANTQSDAAGHASADLQNLVSGKQTAAHQTHTALTSDGRMDVVPNPETQGTRDSEPDESNAGDGLPSSRRAARRYTTFPSDSHQIQSSRRLAEVGGLPAIHVIIES